ncbi:MAG: hypothetical protein AB8B71_00585 [Paracoccaceae bacterium]
MFLIQRARAGIIDAGVGLVGTGLVGLGLLWVSDPADLARINPYPLIFTLIVTTNALLTRGNTYGKRRSDLQVIGTGCIICREIRRLLPLWVFGITALLAPFIPIPAGLIPILLALLIIFGYALPLVQRAPDFPHNTATGFDISTTAHP